MKNIIPTFLALIIFLSVPIHGFERINTDSILGRHFAALAVAVEEFKKEPLDLNNYEIRILEEKEVIHFLFGDPFCEHKHFGSCPNLSSYEVTIEKESLKVLKSHYSR